MNNWNPVGQPTQFNQFNQPQMYGQRQQTSYPFTNVSYVTSLEEALIRTTQFNSDMIYFNQDRNEFYRVRVDTDGRKSYLTFVYALPEPAPAPTPQANPEEFAALSARVEALEKLMKKEGTENA
jgi:hypothetical protein